jgi:hypothetical protein
MSPRRLRLADKPRATFALLLTLAVWAERAGAEPGSGQNPAQLAAEAAFADGVRLMKEARCAEAVERFEESQRLEPASGTLLDLAYCQVQLGRVASAWIAYRRAIPLAVQSHKPLHEKIAREQADKLEPDLPRLAIVVTGGAERQLTLELDGAPLARETWSVAMPVDPGSHRVAARLEDGRDWQTDVTAALAERAQVEVPLARAPQAPLTVAAVQPSAPAKVDYAPPRAPRAAVLRPAWALGVTALGTAAVVVGGGMFVSARLEYDGARERCDADNVCAGGDADDELSARARARAAAFVASGGALVAGAGLLAYLLLGEAPDQSRITVTSVAGPWSLGVRGRF